MNGRVFVLLFIAVGSGGLHAGAAYESNDTNYSGTEILLNSSEHSLHISLVKLDHGGHGMKRTSFKNKKFIWTYHIPYVIDFHDPARRMRLRKVMDSIEDNLCVKFYSIEGKIDLSDPHWPKEHGFKTDAYIKFHSGKGCVSSYGKGNGHQARLVSPCYKWLSMMHETLHALGAVHGQKMPGREKYITVHNNNINRHKVSQYLKAQKDRVNSVYFDSASNLLYGDNFFGKKDEHTYDFLRPDMGHLVGIRSTKTLFYEMNQNYKCQKKYCSHVTTDCGPGYLTFLHGECVCICPDQYDPLTNCTTLKDNIQGPKSWPNTPFTLYKAGDCPDGFTQGTIPLVGKSAPTETEDPFPIAVTGNTLNLEVCTKTTPTTNASWSDWSLGSYCVGKVKGVSCGFPFQGSSFVMTEAKHKDLKGSVGDVTFEGKHLKMKMCCDDDGPPLLPMSLPTSKPFKLVMTTSHCQEVEGMFAVQTKIKTQVKTHVTGFNPLKKKRTVKSLNYSPCAYIPPVYGCNSIFKLDGDKRTASFSVPRKGQMREGSRRCFYAFQAPDKSRLRLTFNSFSIHPKDKVLVKRYHPWTNPFRVKENSRPSQIITEKNYLFVEYWSYYKEDSSYTGMDLTVDLLLDDEMCYNADLKGSDYAGDKSVSELYDQCIPWNDATTCREFPWKHSLILLNSGNKCRNLDVAEMLQPWCYVKVDGLTCVRRYCDVCNEAAPIDVSHDCNKKLKANPKACDDTEFKNKCYKSCGTNPNHYDQSQVKCSKPLLQSTVSFEEPLQDSYTLGAAVGVTCKGQHTQIKCTTHGWTPFDVKCVEGSCMDASELCPETLKKFPDFCTHRKSQVIASAYCSKTCGVC